LFQPANTKLFMLVIYIYILNYIHAPAIMVQYWCNNGKKRVFLDLELKV
jgi:hypothetical protein